MPEAKPEDMPLAIRGGMWRDTKDCAWDGDLVRRAIVAAQAEALREVAVWLDQPCVFELLPFHKRGDGAALADWLRQRAEEIERG
jgi:hypothetical protein